MRDVAPLEREVLHAGDLHVVDVGAAPLDQARVLAPLDALADQLGQNGGCGHVLAPCRAVRVAAVHRGMRHPVLRVRSASSAPAPSARADSRRRLRQHLGTQTPAQPTSLTDCPGGNKGPTGGAIRQGRYTAPSVNRTACEGGLPVPPPAPRRLWPALRRPDEPRIPSRGLRPRPRRASRRPTTRVLGGRNTGFRRQTACGFLVVAAQVVTRRRIPEAHLPPRRRPQLQSQRSAAERQGAVRCCQRWLTNVARPRQPLPLQARRQVLARRVVLPVLAHAETGIHRPLPPEVVPPRAPRSHLQHEGRRPPSSHSL